MFQPLPDPCFSTARAKDTGLAKLEVSLVAVTATGSSIVQRCSFLAQDLVS